MSELKKILDRSTLLKEEKDFVINKYIDLINCGVPENEAKLMSIEILKNNALDTLQDMFAQLGIRSFSRIKNTEKIKGGLSDDKSINEIAKKHNVSIDDILEQLAIGVKIEKEHTDDIYTAIEIAKDHLFEFPTYYTELDKMEQSLKDKEKEK
jgi:hypothetical protein